MSDDVGTHAQPQMNDHFLKLPHGNTYRFQLISMVIYYYFVSILHELDIRYLNDLIKSMNTTGSLSKALESTLLNLMLTLN